MSKTAYIINNNANNNTDVTKESEVHQNHIVTKNTHNLKSIEELHNGNALNSENHHNLDNEILFLSQLNSENVLSDENSF